MAICHAICIVPRRTLAAPVRGKQRQPALSDFKDAITSVPPREPLRPVLLLSDCNRATPTRAALAERPCAQPRPSFSYRLNEPHTSEAAGAGAAAGEPELGSQSSGARAREPEPVAAVGVHGELRRRGARQRRCRRLRQRHRRARGRQQHRLLRPAEGRRVEGRGHIPVRPGAPRPVPRRGLRGQLRRVLPRPRRDVRGGVGVQRRRSADLRDGLRKLPVRRRHRRPHRCRR